MSDFILTPEPKILTLAIEPTERRPVTVDVSFRLADGETLTSAECDDSGTGVADNVTVSGTAVEFEALGLANGTVTVIIVTAVGSAGSVVRFVISARCIDPSVRVSPVVVPPSDHLMRFRGDYAAEGVYQQWDVVLYSGTWVALIDTPAQAPGIDPLEWEHLQAATGTTAGTVAAGNDSRIIAGGTALQPAGNGSQLTGITPAQTGAAPAAKGVTNGDTHDHSGGDGAQIDHGGLAGNGDDDHTQYHNDARGDLRYAPIAKGVTNGDSHNHTGGAGAQIDHANLANKGTNTHATIDTLLPTSGQKDSLATRITPSASNLMLTEGQGLSHVATLQALRDWSHGPITVAFVQAHTTAGDGGHGQFRYVSGAAPGTYTDNDGTIVVPTGGDGSAAWLRVYSILSPSMFKVDKTGGTDSYAAFSAAINTLPSAGGIIAIDDGSYLLSSEPTWGAKNIMWLIGPGCVFTGAGTGVGKFPYMNTNTAQMAVGPFIQSQSQQHSAHANGGVAAFNIEMIQPVDYGAGQSVGLYLGARGSSTDAGANVWALNSLIAVDSGAAGTYQNIEVDVDCNSSAATVKGISLSGGGTANPDVAIEITRLAGIWDRGIHVLNSQDAIRVIPVSGGRGLVIGSPTAFGNSGITVQQYANGAEAVMLQRNTDTGPTGYFMRAINAANSASLFTLDASGNVFSAGNISATGNISTATGAITGNIITGNNFRALLGANAVSAGVLAIGSSTSATANVGAATLPANPLGFLIAYLGATEIKIPYYNT